MRHQDYVRERSARDPTFGAHRAAARAELALGEKVAERRDNRNLSLAEVAQRSGIEEARLAAIEEGESMSVYELLWLCHALDIQVWIDNRIRVRVSPVSLGEDRGDHEAAAVHNRVDVVVADR